MAAPVKRKQVDRRLVPPTVGVVDLPARSVVHDLPRREEELLVANPDAVGSPDWSETLLQLPFCEAEPGSCLGADWTTSVTVDRGTRALSVFRGGLTRCDNGGRVGRSGSFPEVI